MDTAGPGSRLFILTRILTFDICPLTPVLGDVPEGPWAVLRPHPSPQRGVKGGARNELRAGLLRQELCRKSSGAVHGGPGEQPDGHP